MDFKNLSKRLRFSDFQAPTKLEFDDLVAKPLTREDLDADLEAVNSSLEIIRQTRGGTWPQEELSKDFDLLDLAWHEREFRDGSSFAYVVYSEAGDYIGCVYLYPMGVRTELTEELIEYDVDVSWWVTSESYEHGYYEKIYRAIQEWMKQFPVEKIYYSNKEIPA